MSTRRPRSLLLGSGAALALLAASAPADPRDLRLELSPSFEGTLVSGAPVPTIVTVSNRGPAAVGTITWADDAGDTRIEIPVELPQNSTKSIAVSVSRYSWNTPLVGLETNQGSLEARVLTPNGANATVGVLMISDHSGELGFLTKQKTKGQFGETLGTAVAYVKPDRAFSRESDYGPVSAVILGEGSERMGATAFRALRDYVLRGGNLVLLGGASAPVLTHPELAGLVPFSALTPREISVDGTAVSAQVPTAKPAAARLANLDVPALRSGYGLGTVTYLSTNPTEGAPLPSRQRTMSVAIDSIRSSQAVSRALASGPNLGGTVEAVAPTTSNAAIDPFSLEIPPTETIFLVLGIYFVVVIPVNFLVLKAFKRLEWAWFSAPAISLVFAAVLFRNAGSLYGAREGTGSRTMILAAGGRPEALAMGTAKMFFPNASRQSLPVQDATFLSGNDQLGVSGEYYGPRASAKPIPLTLAPDPVVTSYDTGALEFRDMSFRQRFDLGGGIVLRREGEGYAVENRSRLNLLAGRIIARRGDSTYSAPVPALGPGERRPVAKPKDDATNNVLETYARGHALYIAGVDGPRFGPAVGEPVAARTSTTIVVSEGG